MSTKNLIYSIERIIKKNMNITDKNEFHNEYERTKKDILEVIDYFEEFGNEINDEFLDNWEINGWGMQNIAKDIHGNIIEIEDWIDEKYINNSLSIEKAHNDEEFLKYLHIDLKNNYWNEKYLEDEFKSNIELLQSKFKEFEAKNNSKETTKER